MKKTLIEVLLILLLSVVSSAQDQLKSKPNQLSEAYVKYFHNKSQYLQYTNPVALSDEVIGKMSTSDIVKLMVSIKDTNSWARWKLKIEASARYIVESRELVLDTLVQYGITSDKGDTIWFGPFGLKKYKNDKKPDVISYPTKGMQGKNARPVQKSIIYKVELRKATPDYFWENWIPKQLN